MVLGLRWGSHRSSSSAHARRRLAGATMSRGHSSCIVKVSHKYSIGDVGICMLAARSE